MHVLPLSLIIGSCEIPRIVLFLSLCLSAATRNVDRMRISKSALALLLPSLCAPLLAAARNQLPLFTNPDVDDQAFSIYRHEEIPGQIRYKRNDGWCDSESVKSWSGYLDHEDKHYFFSYFESRSKPKEDPVVLWINGQHASMPRHADLTRLIAITYRWTGLLKLARPSYGARWAILSL